MIEGNEDEALNFAMAGGSIVLMSAVILREVIFKNARRRFVEAQKQLDFNTDRISKNKRQVTVSKISIEQNAAIVKNIKEKSRAAKVLSKLPDAHREVFENCHEYLLLSAEQIKNAGVGSPRLAAFKKSRQVIKELHRFHLLVWIEFETRNLSRKSDNSDTISERINIAGHALDLLDSGLRYYPNESRLTDSQQFLQEYIDVSRILAKVEEAENAFEKGDFQNASDLYKSSLSMLEDISFEVPEREELAEKIYKEIKKLSTGSKEKRKNFKRPTDFEKLI